MTGFLKRYGVAICTIAVGICTLFLTIFPLDFFWKIFAGVCAFLFGTCSVLVEQSKNRSLATLKKSMANEFKTLSKKQFQRLAEALEPLAVARMSPDPRVIERQLTRSIERILDLAPLLLNSVDIKTTIFKLEKRAGAGTKLKNYCQRGENRKSRDFVKGDDGRGDHGLMVAQKRTSFILPDMSIQELPFGVERSNNYNSFISSSIFAGETVYGLVSISAHGEDRLTDVDLTSVELIATLLGQCFNIEEIAGLNISIK